MATASAPASVRKVRALGTTVTAKPEGMPRETVLLIAGGAVAVVFWVIAMLNFVGLLNIQIRPGEGTGANPAIDFFVIGLLCLIAPYGFAATAKQHRIAKIEERLPDFLRDVAEAGRFGMTLPDAIVVASKGRYGLLTDEIKKMASQLEWGVPVATAMRLFEERVPTPLVQRVVSIVTRAQRGRRGTSPTC